MPSEQLEVILKLTAGQYKREAREASTATGRIANSADSASTATGRLSTKMGDLGDAAKARAKVGLLAAGAALLAFARDSARAASDLNESINAVNQIFGEASDKVLEFGKVASSVSGLAASEFNQLAVSTGGLLTNLGFSFNDAGTESIRLAQRAADMASVLNKDVPQAMEAINAALRGETEPLRAFNVQLSDAAVRAKAVELGLADSAAEVDNHGKAVASLELIYEQTAAMQGDFIRTSEDAANASRVLAAEFENTKAAFGQNTVGAKNFFTAAASDFLGLVNLTGLFGKEAKEATTQAWLMEDALYVIKEAIKDSEDPYTALADGLLHIAEGGDLTTAQFEALAIAAGLGEDQFEDFGRVVLAQARSIGVTEDEISELEAAIYGAGTAADDTAPRIDELTGYLARIAEVQEQFNDALDWFTTEGAPDAARWLDEVGLSAAGSVDEVLRLKVAFEQAGFAAAELAGAPIFGGVRVGGGGGTGPQARWTGGPVHAGAPYIVGEHGPEMFIPAHQGTIANRAETRRMMQEGDTNITVVVPVKNFADLAQESAREIERILDRRRREVF